MPIPSQDSSQDFKPRLDAGLDNFSLSLKLELGLG